ncbi:MAG: twin-arginine translocase TatA/TatE family subunit [Acidimicrobiia bacterium]|nr:twin-arginine translocase TatA/TatE family subunit [Acidimicrobiia bacterium]
MPTSLGPAEILVILVVALVVLGPKRLPEAGRQIGRFVSEVRHWSSAVQAEISNVIDLQGEPQPPPPATPPVSMPAQPPPVPTPQDLSPPSTPASPPPPRQSPAAEWGLAEPGPNAEPQPAPAAPPPTSTEAPPTSTAGGLPPEWAAPPSPNGNN